MALIAQMVAAVILGGSFGTATATLVTLEADVMVVEIEVEVLEAAASVVAHLTFQEEPVLTLPLLDRGDGVFGIRTELPPKNYVVVFEILGSKPVSSGPVSLSQMGADFNPASGPTTTTGEEGGLSAESQRLLWLAVALAAGSLSILAFWVLGGRGADEEPEAIDDAG